MTTLEGILECGLRYQGAPYTWKGKGLYLWTPQGLALHSFGEHVFDCSGFVGQAIADAGGPNWIGTRSAETYRTSLPMSVDPWAFGGLRIYGHNGKANHIAIVLQRGFVLESAGGDSTTTSPSEAAKRRNARVRVNRDRRVDFMCTVTLPFDAHP